MTSQIPSDTEAKPSDFPGYGTALAAFEKILSRFRETQVARSLRVVDFNHRDAKGFERTLDGELKGLELQQSGAVYVDISGLPSYGICIVLHACRVLFPFRDMEVLYTEASQYYPSRAE